ncbi:MAG: hypothetical protein IH860_09980 [Chloroflexi bacterium]|nr:hypothetical protein [Chloroflexota bacterium]
MFNNSFDPYHTGRTRDRPFDFAQDRPFDFAQDRSFDFAPFDGRQDRPHC